MKLEGGEKSVLIIRRLRCPNCRRLHNELPDCVTPYKHYAAETISGVLDGIVTPDDDDAEDYPCEQTMRRWILWLKENHDNIEGSLRRAGHTILGLGERILSSPGSLLEAIRTRYQNWLEIILRVIYNSGGNLVSGW